MTNYYVDFNNNANQTWTMGVYQEIPDSVGLDSVSWKQSTAPVGGQTGVSWNVDYNVALANYRQEGGKGVYKASQTLATELGKKWKIVYADGVQQLIADGSTTDGQIEIFNESGLLANPGIGMSGTGSVFKSNVLNQSAAQFVVKPTYYFGLFNQLELGEVIASNVVVGPLKLEFPSGLNKATVDAKVVGETLKLEITYSHGAVFNMKALAMHPAMRGKL